MERIESLKLGIDALDFLKGIPDEIWEQIDTIVFDPPYFDEGNEDHMERFNDRKGRILNNSFIMMDVDHRNNILNYIRSKMKKGFIIRFHSDDVGFDGQKHIWFKHRIGLGGGSMRRNHEYIWIEPINTKLPIMGGLEFILSFPLKGSKNQYNGNKHRTAMKPTDLFKRLFSHLKSKFVLDPFAGFGNQIIACRHLRISIFACDMDKSLQWRPNRIHKRL